MPASAALVAGSAHVVAAFDALLHELSGGTHPRPNPGFDFEDVTCGLFVTWNKASHPGEDVRLRGCIGTLEPRALHAALPEYALTAALGDRRFTPVALAELPSLRCTVSLLHSFEQAGSWDDWQLGIHGIVISFGDPATGAHRSATFLPEVALHQRWGKGAAVDQLVRKAGYAPGATPAVRRALTLRRYQTSAHTLSYQDYDDLRRKAPRRARQPPHGEAPAEDAIPVPA